MATMFRTSNGHWVIQMTCSDRKRRSLRLGKMSEKQANSIKVKVDELAAAKLADHAPNDETIRWLNRIEDALHDKLAAIRLTRPRSSVTVVAFVRQYIDQRADIKPATRLNLERSLSYLTEAFGTEKRLRDVTPANAESFRQHLLRSGRAEGTVRRAIGRARQFFAIAIRHELILHNPFEGMSAAVGANHERMRYIKAADVERVIRACPNHDWRMIFALCRYGGLRCPSEVLALTWADIHWDSDPQMERIHITSPKTARQGKPSHIIPLFPELRPHLLAAYEAAEEGSKYVVARYRRNDTNLGTHAKRIILRAGLQP